MDQIEFAELIRDAISVYPSAEVPGKRAISFWYKLLGGVEPDLLHRALLVHQSNSEFPPTPASILKILNGGDLKSKAIEAWDELHASIRLIGPYRTPVFSDPRTDRAVAFLGGWVRLCSATETELNFLKKDFMIVFSESNTIGSDSATLFNKTLHNKKLLGLSNLSRQSREIQQEYPVCVTEAAKSRVQVAVLLTELDVPVGKIEFN